MGKNKVRCRHKYNNNSWISLVFAIKSQNLDLNKDEEHECLANYEEILDGIKAFLISRIHILAHINDNIFINMFIR